MRDRIERILYAATCGCIVTDALTIIAEGVKAAIWIWNTPSYWM